MCFTRIKQNIFSHEELKIKKYRLFVSALFCQNALYHNLVAMKHILIYNKVGSVLLETRRHTIGAKKVTSHLSWFECISGFVRHQCSVSQFLRFWFFEVLPVMCWVLKTLFIFITCHRDLAAMAPDRYEYLIKDATRVFKKA